MKILPWIITGIAILFIVYNHYTRNRSTTRPIEAEIEHYYLKSQTAQWLGNEGLEVKNVKLYYGNDSSQNKPLYDLIQKPTLIYCVSGRMCSSCIQFGWNKMKEYFGEIANNPNIIFIVSDITPREKRSIYHNQCYSYLSDTETLQLPVETSVIPFFFVLDTDRKVKMLFCPDSTNPLYTEKYLEIVSRRILKKLKP